MGAIFCQHVDSFFDVPATLVNIFAFGCAAFVLALRRSMRRADLIDKSLVLKCHLVWTTMNRKIEIQTLEYHGITFILIDLLLEELAHAESLNFTCHICGYDTSSKNSCVF